MPAESPPRFCRFRSDAPAGSRAYSQLPDDGFCISVFLLLRSSTDAVDVLAGRIDPARDWERIGGLPAERAKSAAAGWMLPSRHLQLFEGPEEAARTILREQLELDPLALRGPRVISETYDREASSHDPHWDLHLLFEGTWPSGRPLRASPWDHLEFVDLRRTPPTAFVRGHGDILAFAGTPSQGRPS
ncbi:MAG TPA: hypothetical protein VFG07_08205 [Thermoplasmata archaeon]|nr:hypothetical protein [Thermoplasmata archaeon]